MRKLPVWHGSVLLSWWVVESVVSFALNLGGLCSIGSSLLAVSARSRICDRVHPAKRSRVMPRRVFDVLTSAVGLVLVLLPRRKPEPVGAPS
jgi:hypothetical protein